MKVYIHYKPYETSDSFEGARLRKTLKGACELVDVSWVDTPQDGIQAAHFIAPDDLELLRAQKALGVPTVVSAFYAEDDPEASCFDRRDKRSLRKKALQFLNEADLVLVPDSYMAGTARALGVNSCIEVLEPAVRMNRFSKTAAEKRIFLRYFDVRPDAQIVVTTGSYADKQIIGLIKKVAERCPNLQFYYFGAKSYWDVFDFARKSLSRKKPVNLHFRDLVQDDIYRSALMNSVAYISNDTFIPDPVGPLEAFASRTQVVAFAGARKNPLLCEGESCFFFRTPEEMAAYLGTLNSESSASTIEPAYAIAKAHNLVFYGEKLKGYYEALASGEYR